MEHVKKGQNDWQEMINTIIDYLNNGEAVEGLKVTDWSHDGIVFLNGTTEQSNSLGYRYIQFNGVKLVQVDLKLQGPTVKDRQCTLCKLPTSIAPLGKFVHYGESTWNKNAGNCYITGAIVSDTISVTLVTPNVPSAGWNTGISGSAMYFHADND